MMTGTDLPPREMIGAVVLIFGEEGDLPPPAEAARTVVAAHQRYSDATLTLAVSGFDDDPRKVCDIPEAKDFYAGLMRILALCPWAKSLAKAIDDTSMTIMALCADALPRERVVFVPKGEDA
jgi:hypothetical protein